MVGDLVSGVKRVLIFEIWKNDKGGGGGGRGEEEGET